MSSQLKLEELVQDSRVHRRIYLEQEIFELEMERIFERNWVFVGHESEVAAPGDYKTVPIGTQPAIMTRDEDGDIHVADESLHASRRDHLPGPARQFQFLPMLVSRLDLQQ